MKYLKTFEQLKNSNTNCELLFPSYETSPFDIDERNKAFKEGSQAFSDGKNIHDNPYVDQAYPIKDLIDSWNDGFNNKELNISFNESKQVGILYHFTGLLFLVGIIKSNKLIASKISSEYMGKVTYAVSFTRDKNLYTKNPDAVPTECRIVLDGNKLSHHYKIVPYNYFWDLRGGSRHHDQGNVESEEMVVFNDNKYNGIIDIKKYILRIDILNDSRWDDREGVESWIETKTPGLLDLLKENNIKYNIINI